jgi:adenosylcobinamide-GDP ribazoletransferase
MRGALAFLTIFGRARQPAPGDVAWFPVVGVGIGAVTGAVWWFASHWWPPLIAAVIAVVADLVLTGMLHMDGLADSADGLLPHLDRARRLDVMAAPDTGAFAVVTLTTVLVARTAGFTCLGLGGLSFMAVTAGLWALSRGVMAIALLTMRYARTTGLASSFAPPSAPGSRLQRVTVVVTTLVLGVGLVMVGRGPAAGLLIAAVALGAAAGVLALAHRRLGGYTGDVLGAAGVVLETIGLIAANAQP